VEVLPDEVARVEVEAEALPVADRVEGASGGPVVVGDLTRVDLVGEAHPHLVEDVDDRVPALGKILVPSVDHLWRHGGKSGQGDPDGGPGEAHHRPGAKAGSGPGGVFHLLRRTPANS